MKKLLFLFVLIPAILFSQNSATPTFAGLPVYPITCSYKPGSALEGADNDSTDSQKKFIKVISISAYAGTDFYRDGFEDRTIFQQAAPNSILAFNDLAGYSNEQRFFYNFSSRLAMSSGLNVNLRLRGQQKFGEVRIGLAHSVVNVSSQSYFKEETTPLSSDTLSNGIVFNTDSVALAGYNYQWNAEIIHLHLGWIVRTDPKRWLSLYTGFGLSGGVGFNGIVSASHVHSSYHTTYSNAGNSSNGYSTSSTNYERTIDVSEKFRAPSFTSVAANIPIGMNIRLSRRNNFFKHVALFGEYNAAIQFILPKGVDPKTRTISSAYGGVRWYIQAPRGEKALGRQNRKRNNQRNPE